jgi:hypothetical protein
VDSAGGEAFAGGSGLKPAAFRGPAATRRAASLGEGARGRRGRPWNDHRRSGVIKSGEKTPDEAQAKSFPLPPSAGSAGEKLPPPSLGAKLDPQVFPLHLRGGTIPARSLYGGPRRACLPLRSLNSSICRSGILARHRAVEYATSLDEPPMSGKVARPAGRHFATSLGYTPLPSGGNTCGSSLALGGGAQAKSFPLPRSAGEGGPAGPGEGVVPAAKPQIFPSSESDRASLPPLPPLPGHPLPRSLGGEGKASGGASLASSAFDGTLVNRQI